jgi:hypothetical protein
MKKQIHIGVIVEPGLCVVKVGVTQSDLLEKLVLWLKSFYDEEDWNDNEMTFNTLQDFENYVYEREEFNEVEIFFKTEDLDLSK